MNTGTKFWNIGLNFTDGVRIGMIVRSETLDEAVSRMCAFAAEKGISVRSGSFGQLCTVDSEAENAYFDRTFRFLGTLY